MDLFVVDKRSSSTNVRRRQMFWSVLLGVDIMKPKQISALKSTDPLGSGVWEFSLPPSYILPPLGAENGIYL